MNFPVSAGQIGTALIRATPSGRNPGLFLSIVRARAHQYDWPFEKSSGSIDACRYAFTIWVSREVAAKAQEWSPPTS